jgi:hypothetical protein
MADALMLLGHPSFRTLFYELEEEPAPDPGVVLVAILSCEDLDTRIIEAAPWIILRFEHLDWEWIIREARERRVQNRLGFLVNLAAQVAADNYAEQERLIFLTRLEERLFEFRMDKEDTLCVKRMTEAEKVTLREARTSEARQWGLLTDLRARDIDCPGF